ncbi:helix-turn-helix transcriptional regulator [Ferrimonas pelagia]|uniref:HTH cro/C1-type domain-containing protein n=1 Tax=Ferrimonas pelagia TaxID=1177826 RepID=A0ABP9EQR4_9GAMM
MTTIKELVQKLIYTRKQRGLGQGDFEGLAGFKQQQISRMEKANDMKLSNFLAWADSLGYDVTLVERDSNQFTEAGHKPSEPERPVNLIHQILGKSSAENEK